MRNNKTETEIKDTINDMIASLEAIREGLSNSAMGLRDATIELNRMQAEVNRMPPSENKLFMNHLIDTNMKTNKVSLTLFIQTNQLITMVRELIESAVKEE